VELRKLWLPQRIHLFILIFFNDFRNWKSWMWKSQRGDQRDICVILLKSVANSLFYKPKPLWRLIQINFKLFHTTWRLFLPISPLLLWLCLRISIQTVIISYSQSANPLPWIYPYWYLRGSYFEMWDTPNSHILQSCCINLPIKDLGKWFPTIAILQAAEFFVVCDILALSVKELKFGYAYWLMTTSRRKNSKSDEIKMLRV